MQVAMSGSLHTLQVGVMLCGRSKLAHNSEANFARASLLRSGNHVLAAKKRTAHTLRRAYLTFAISTPFGRRSVFWLN